MERIRKWAVPTVCGFLALYLAIMLACTFLVRQKRIAEFQIAAAEKRALLVSLLENMDVNERWSEDERLSYFRYIVSANLNTDTPYQQFAAQLYEKESGGIAQSRSGVKQKGLFALNDLGEKLVYYYPLADFLTEEEIRELARCAAENQRQVTGEKYRFVGMVTEDDRQLCRLLVQEIDWELCEDGEPQGETDPFTGTVHSMQTAPPLTENYIQIASRVIWQWEDRQADLREAKTVQMDINLPYMIYGYQAWERWENNTYLQELPVPEEGDGSNRKIAFSQESSGTSLRMDYSFALGGDEMKMASLTLAGQCRPWAAAMHDLSAIYLGGFLLMCTCAGTVLFVYDKNARQQAQIEANRRDFINAMAHKMKTPLGIIRGSAENLQEDTVAKKRAYYLEQIIRQTEEMDDMVAKTLSTTRLESGRLTLQKDSVRVAELLREQLRKFQPMIEEKEMSVEFLEKDAFELTGDREYLEKAFWNLLDNAVRYNRPSGIVRIETWETGCRIENTSAATGREAGVGLYLTERIFTLHHINMKVEELPERFIVELSEKPHGQR